MSIMYTLFYYWLYHDYFYFEWENVFKKPLLVCGCILIARSKSFYYRLLEALQAWQISAIQER